ncbi:Protein NDRG2 [Collichthys lucidus]|uniref:Protein NDRG2 n=1 Tax=Collichthys lucidus TaxID=240159 RepID=A0A4U5VXM3_COLLU|nr:Protein NDRG2 [Collichthys lucidus]
MNVGEDAELAARILLDQGQEHSIETPHGVLHVTLHGTRTTRRPAILTFHDVGLDSKSCFSPLFKFEEMQEIVKNFTLIHIDAPGQEEGGAAYPTGYQYPSMDTVAEMIPAVLQFFNFRTVIGVGVGAGAYILSKFALANPDSVEGLVLVNIDTNARGWIDWAAQKLSSVTSSLTEQILSHLFSQEELSSNTDLVQSHRERISKASNLVNIELFWKTYNRSTQAHTSLHKTHTDNRYTSQPTTTDIFSFPSSRRDLNIERNSTFKCPVMLVVGDQAPYEDAAMADAGGLPQLTQPAKLTEAFKYFIQGMGYMASSCMTRLSRSRTTSLSSSYSMDGSRSRSRTLSQGSQGGQMPPSPSQTMERMRRPRGWIHTGSGASAKKKEVLTFISMGVVPFLHRCNATGVSKKSRDGETTVTGKSVEGFGFEL